MNNMFQIIKIIFFNSIRFAFHLKNAGWIQTVLSWNCKVISNFFTVDGSRHQYDLLKKKNPTPNVKQILKQYTVLDWNLRISTSSCYNGHNLVSAVTYTRKI